MVNAFRYPTARILAVALVLLLAVFSHAARSARTEPLRIITQSGSHDFLVEVVDTDESRAKGLMFRRHMADDHGMLFDFIDEQEVGFWMRNTYISLDMIFIRADGIVHRIATDTVPLSEKSVPSRGAVRFVLELNAGQSRHIGLEAGDRIEHARIKP